MRHVLFIAMTQKRSLAWRASFAEDEAFQQELMSSTCMNWTMPPEHLRGLDRGNTALMVHPAVGSSALVDAARRLFPELSSPAELRQFLIDGRVPKR